MNKKGPPRKSGRPPTDAEIADAWEEICDGCGKCCEIGKGVACPSLDTETNQCRNYENRKTTEMCLKVTIGNVEALHARGVLPDSCAYVRFLNNEPPLPRPVEGAKLIPFELAHPALGKLYLLTREKWLAKQSTSEVDQPEG